MFSVYIWIRLIVGVMFMVAAFVMWMQDQPLRLLMLRWLSLSYIAMGFCACFSAGKILTHQRAFGLWGFLQLAALLAAACMFAIAVFYGAREMQRGPEKPGQRV